MDHGDHSMGTGGPGDHTMAPMPPMKMHKMWMWFHTVPNDTVLFEFWTVTTVQDMVIACAIVFLASVVLELIKFIRVQVERRFESESSFNTSYTSRLFSLQHLIETLLFGIQITLSYILMLVFMTFSVWLGLAVALGLATGYYFFGARQFNVKTSEAVLVGHVTHN